MSNLHWKDTGDVLVLSLTTAKLETEDDVQTFGVSLLQVAKLTGQTRKKVLLDFTGVEMVSSAIIGKLVLFHNRLKARSVQLRICGMSPAIESVFKRTMFPGE